MELRVIRIEPNIQKISVNTTTLSLSTRAIYRGKKTDLFRVIHYILLKVGFIWKQIQLMIYILFGLSQVLRVIWSV